MREIRTSAPAPDLDSTDARLVRTPGLSPQPGHNPLEVEAKELGRRLLHDRALLHDPPAHRVPTDSGRGAAGRNLSTLRPAAHDGNHSQNPEALPDLQTAQFVRE